MTLEILVACVSNIILVATGKPIQGNCWAGLSVSLIDGRGIRKRHTLGPLDEEPYPNRDFFGTSKSPFKLEASLANTLHQTWNQKVEYR